MGEDFSRQTRRFSAAILTYGKGNRHGMAGIRPARRRATIVNTGSKLCLVKNFLLEGAPWFFKKNKKYRSDNLTGILHMPRINT
ncbi:MAG: hypothetical protein OSJ58_06955 [Dysosmobacter sp.]|nr:hypothetical protein [Dysosmobacter sp.]